MVTRCISGQRHLPRHPRIDRDLRVSATAGWDQIGRSSAPLALGGSRVVNRSRSDRASSATTVVALSCRKHEAQHRTTERHPRPLTAAIHQPYLSATDSSITHDLRRSNILRSSVGPSEIALSGGGHRRVSCGSGSRWSVQIHNVRGDIGIALPSVRCTQAYNGPVYPCADFLRFVVSKKLKHENKGKTGGELPH